MKNQSKKIKGILSFFFAFVIILGLILVSLSITFNLTIFNKNFVNQRFVKIKYTDRVLADLKEELYLTTITYFNDQEMTDEFLHTCLDDTFLTIRISSEITRLFDGNSSKINTEEFIENIKPKLIELTTKYEYNESEDYQEQIDEMCKDLSKIYYNVTYLPAEYYYSFKDDVQNVSLVALVLGLLMIILGTVCISVTYKRAHLKFFYFSLSALSAFAFYALPFFYLYFSKIPFKINLEPDYLNDIIKQVAIGMQNALLMDTIIFGILSVITLTLYFVIRKDFKRK